MANFCKKCGSPVDQSTGLCPNCTKAEFVNMQLVAVIEPKSDYINMPVADEKSSKTSKRNKTLSDKKPRKRNKKLIVAIISAILVVLIIGGIFIVPMLFGADDFEKQFNSDMDIFGGGDIDAINRLIMHQPEIPEDLVEFIPKTQSSGEGLMGDLIALADIELESYTESTVVVMVTAPDMSRFGEYILTVSIDDVEDSLKQTVLDYASNAEKIEEEITLNYTIKDDKYEINYNEPLFLNAITGNFSEAYSTIYSQYIMDLAQEVENYD